MLKTVFSPAGCNCVGNYSACTIYNGFGFISGQISTDPVSGRPVRGSIEEQTRCALGSMKEIIVSIGSAMENVLMVNIYISSMELFARMDRAYREFFPDGPPARVTVGVADLNGVDIEISCVVAVPTSA